MITTAISQVVEQELLKMLARGLDFSPSPGDLPAKVAVTCEDLYRHGFKDSDAPRIAAAFQFLGSRLQKWPTSKQIIDVVPPAPGLKQLEYDGGQNRRLHNMKKFVDIVRGNITPHGGKP